MTDKEIWEKNKIIDDVRYNGILYETRNRRNSKN